MSIPADANQMTSPEMVAVQYAVIIPRKISGTGSATTANSETKSGYERFFLTLRMSLYCRV